MSEPLLSEIKLVSFNFPPKGWALCNGQSLPINQHQALFSLLGTGYGGYGPTTFNLPNLRGRVPVHMGSGHDLGETAGSTAVTVNIQQLPTHLHVLNASNLTGNKVNPNFGGTGFVLAQEPGNPYGPAQGLTTLNAGSIANVGGSQANNNMMPYLVLTFIIALQGIFPSQN